MQNREGKTYTAQHKHAYAISYIYVYVSTNIKMYNTIRDSIKWNNNILCLAALCSYLIHGMHAYM